MSGRREEAKGGTRRCRDTAFTRCVWESPRSQCRQGGFVLLALACSAARRLGESAPRWPAGSPAQWQRPRMWICVGPRDPDTKPSRGRLCVYKTKATTRFPPCKRRGSKVINEKPKLRRGCSPAYINETKPPTAFLSNKCPCPRGKASSLSGGVCVCVRAVEGGRWRGDDDELLVRASAVLKSQGPENRPPRRPGGVVG